ncbi:MAG: hypothetical protein PHO20_05810 [Candidatus Peribacteraceae bacterium]|nr:hypothetical protein [Candidatus Peribacteraceae bacterium]
MAYMATQCRTFRSSRLHEIYIDLRERPFVGGSAGEGKKGQDIRFLRGFAQCGEVLFPVLV